MRKILEYGFITVVSCFFSCEGGTTKIENINNFNTIIVEDCEYIYDRSVGYRSLVHKGTCKNPIHKCNCN